MIEVKTNARSKEIQRLANRLCAVKGQEDVERDWQREQYSHQATSAGTFSQGPLRHFPKQYGESLNKVLEPSFEGGKSELLVPVLSANLASHTAGFVLL